MFSRALVAARGNASILFAFESEDRNVRRAETFCAKIASKLLVRSVFVVYRNRSIEVKENGTQKLRRKVRLRTSEETLRQAGRDKEVQFEVFIVIVRSK